MPALGARPARRAAPGRRQGRSALPARLRRRPRHRRRPLHRRRAHQPAVARARPGLRRPELHHPRGDRAHRRGQGARTTSRCGDFATAGAINLVTRDTLRRLERAVHARHVPDDRSPRRSPRPLRRHRRAQAARLGAQAAPVGRLRGRLRPGPVPARPSTSALQPVRQGELRPRTAHLGRHVLPVLRLGLDRLGADPRARGRRRPAVAVRQRGPVRGRAHRAPDGTPFSTTAARTTRSTPPPTSPATGSPCGTTSPSSSPIRSTATRSSRTTRASSAAASSPGTSTGAGAASPSAPRSAPRRATTASRCDACHADQPERRLPPAARRSTATSPTISSTWPPGPRRTCVFARWFRFVGGLRADYFGFDVGGDSTGRAPVHVAVAQGLGHLHAPSARCSTST